MCSYGSAIQPKNMYHFHQLDELKALCSTSPDYSYPEIPEWRAETHPVFLRSHLLRPAFVRNGNFHRDVTCEMLLRTDAGAHTCRRSVRSLNIQMSQKHGRGVGVGGSTNRFCRTTWSSDLQAPADLLSDRREQISASWIHPSCWLSGEVIGKMISLPVSHWEQKQVLLYAGVLPWRRKVFRKQGPAGT